MKFRPTEADAITRISDILEAITVSEEWRSYWHVRNLSERIDPREFFRVFFDAYEGGYGEEWLGIMEWAVLEEIKSVESNLISDPATNARIVSRMGGHPNIQFIRGS